ncbi:MAG: pimeloyl-ACP methyl ester carboxylesterase [Candidatus Poriferisodalaceae bacterium]|jgi:pimeloyl-ACP methyl ester carboxylesterase
MDCSARTRRGTERPVVTPDQATQTQRPKIRGVQRGARLIAVAAVVGLLASACSSDGSTFTELLTPPATSEDTGETASGSGAAATVPSTPTTSIVASQTALIDYTPVYKEAPCAFSSALEPGPICGFLTVPEDRFGVVDGSDGDASDFVRIHVARYPAWGQGTPAADPVVYLEGGPGISALEFGDDTAVWLEAINEDRDLILVEPRGIGFSEPTLACPEVDTAVLNLSGDATAELISAAEQKALGECRSRLAGDDIAVAAYGSISSAHDVADLRVALKIPEWNVLGVSYGTYLAQTIARERPEGIRSIILDSSYPLDDDPLFSIPRTGAHALEEVFAACRDDASCDTTYPELERRFQAMVDDLNREPIEVNFGDEEDPLWFDVTGDDVVDASTSALYDAYSFVDIPRLVDLIEDEQLGALSSFVGGGPGALDTGSNIGLYLTVNCRDEVSFADPGVASMGPGELGGNDEAYVADTIGVCEAWDVGQAPPAADVAVTSDLPTLVLAGRFDPITSTYQGKAVADTFSASTYVEFGDRGHGTLGGPCSDAIALEFLAAPGSLLDVSCVDQLPGAPFGPGDLGDLSTISIKVDLDPYDQPALVSVAPVDWYEYDTGLWYRDRSLLDHTGLAYEAVEDSTVAEQVSVNLAWYDLDPAVEQEPIHVNGVTWRHLSFVEQGDHTDIAIAKRSGVTVVVTLTTHPAERDETFAAIWTDVLNATEPR